MKIAEIEANPALAEPADALLFEAALATGVAASCVPAVQRGLDATDGTLEHAGTDIMSQHGAHVGPAAAVTLGLELAIEYKLPGIPARVRHLIAFAGGLTTNACMEVAEGIALHDASAAGFLGSDQIVGTILDAVTAGTASLTIIGLLAARGVYRQQRAIA